MKISRCLVLVFLACLSQLVSSTPEATRAVNNTNNTPEGSRITTTAWQITFPLGGKQLQWCADSGEGAQLITITLTPFDVYRNRVTNTSCQQLWKDQQERIRRASETHGGGKIERLW